VDGVILDLRHNGGGSLPEAIDLTGLFIKEGPVVQIASRDGVMVDEDRDPKVQYDGPLVVLTSRFSASASEIVAGALQDYGRAVVVGGASTHGKGTVQSMSQLAPILFMSGEFFTTNPLALGALKYTTNKFYRVTGSSTQLKGVVSDIPLPSTYDYMETEEGSEEYALKWDTIDPTEYQKLNRVQPYLAELAKRSAARVAKSKDFAYVTEDIGLVKKAMADKTVSLNEKQRLKESAENEARRKTRDAELKARKPSGEKVYDLTLKAGEVVMVEETNSTASLTAVKMGDGTTTYASSDKTNLDTNALNASLSNTVASVVGRTNVAAPQSPSTNDQSGTSPAVVVLKPTPPETPSPEEKAPLDEAEQILSDYINLLHSNPPLAAQPPTAPTNN
jgi:carboxyl-terminal processing protease